MVSCCWLERWVYLMVPAFEQLKISDPFSSYSALGQFVGWVGAQRVTQHHNTLGYGLRPNSTCPHDRFRIAI